MLKAGVYPEIGEDEYHADPAPRPSLNQSTAKVLLSRSPMHAWFQHPRLNPDHHPNHDRKFDIGNVAHRLLLGRGREIQIIHAADYRTKAAQQGRDDALGNGMLPCLEAQYERAIVMRAAALEQIRAAGIEWQPETAAGVLSEVALLWQEQETWFRTKIDRLAGSVCFDYKTTAGACDAVSCQSRMIDDGWHIQAAMHERGLNALKPETRGRLSFLFIAQEASAPYGLTVCQLPESALSLGRYRLGNAVALWRRCMQEDKWPGYCPGQVTVLDPPTWAMRDMVAAAE